VTVRSVVLIADDHPVILELVSLTLEHDARRRPRSRLAAQA